MIRTSNISARVGAILNSQPVVGLAVGVVRGDRMEFFHGHGVADLETREPITADTVFRIASITKTLTAIAVMQLWEQGRVDLDQPATSYLRTLRLASGDLPQPTVRHLLTHTGGLAEVAHARGMVRRDFGEGVPLGQPIPSLAEFYGGELRVYAEPGSRFIYGNHSPAVLGQLVEDVTGQTLARYIGEHIFAPLGMADSDMSRTPRIAAKLATGHEIHSRSVERITDRDLVTVGAGAAYSTPRDMARYLAALLNDGRHSHGRILRPGTLATMFAPHYQPDPRLPGIGLAFFRSRVDGHLVVGHQGTLPGFHSEIALAPDEGVATMAFTNGAHQADFWLPAAVHHLLGDLLPPPEATAPPPAPQRPDVWADLCGTYELDARLGDVRLRAMLGAGVQVFIRGGALMIRFLTPVPALARGIRLLPDDLTDPYMLRLDLPGEDTEPIRVAFGQGSDGSTDRLAVDIMPLVLHKRPKRDRAR